MLLHISPKGVHPEDIKTELRKKYGSLAAFGKRFSITGQAVSQALTKTYSARVEKLIADDLGLPPCVIWPDRWTGDGRPFFRRGVKGDAREVRKQPSKKRKSA